MRSLAQFAALTLAPLLVAATCNQPGPVGPGGGGGTGGFIGVGGAVADDGLAACIAAASTSEGVRNVAAKSGRSLSSAVAELCSSPSLRSCYAEGRCQ